MKITSAQIITQIKTWFFPIAIFIISFLLAQEMLVYFKDFNFSAISLLSLPKIALIMLFLAFVIALSMPAWEGGKFLLIVPLPFSLGIYLNLLILEPLNALLVCGLLFLITAFYTDQSVRLGKLLVRSIPHISLRPAIKGYLLAVSVAATFIVLLNPQRQEINVGKMVSEAISSPIKGYLQKEMGPVGLGIGEQQALEQKLEEEIAIGVKKAIEPYRHLLNVITAVAVFVSMQGLNALVYLVYSLLITPFFWFVKRIGFILADMEEIQREHLHF